MTTPPDERYIPPLHPGPVEKSDTLILSPDAVIQADLNRWDTLVREAYFRVTDTLIDPGADAVALVCREYIAMSADRKKMKEQVHEQYMDMSSKAIANRQTLDELGRVQGELAKLKAAVRKLAENILDVRPGKAFMLAGDDHPIRHVPRKDFHSG